MSTTTLTMTPTNGHNNTTTSTSLKRHLSEIDYSVEEAKTKKRKTTVPASAKAQRIVYRPSENLFDVFQPGKSVKVFIPLKYLLITDVERKVWGTDVYTDDSDLIAACQHVGKFRLGDFLGTGDSKNGVTSTHDSSSSASNNNNNNTTTSASLNAANNGNGTTTNGSGSATASSSASSSSTPSLSSPSGVTTSNVKGVIVGIKVQNPLRKYNSTFRNNIRSRSWNYYNGNAYTIESFKIVRDQPKSKDTGSKAEKLTMKKSNMGDEATESEHKRFLPNVTVVYNLCNEPCLKYSLNMIADRGYNYNDYTSHRLRREVIYLENQSTRYELCQINRRTDSPSATTTTTSAATTAEPSSSSAATTTTATATTTMEEDLSTARYRWARVLKPFMMTSAVMHSNFSVPLATEHLEVLHDDLRWNELQWGIQSVTIRGHTFFIHNIKFIGCSGSSDSNSKTSSPFTTELSKLLMHEQQQQQQHSASSSTLDSNTNTTNSSNNNNSNEWSERSVSKNEALENMVTATTPTLASAAATTTAVTATAAATALINGRPERESLRVRDDSPRD